MEKTRNHFTATPAGNRIRIEDCSWPHRQRYSVYLGRVYLGTWDSIELPADYDFFLTRIDARIEKLGLNK